MAIYTVRWVAALDADAATTYKVYSDEATSGVFVEELTASATSRGDGSYTPYQTTLSSDITASALSLTLASATNFADNDYITIDGEVIKLGGKATNTFSACTRGIGGTVKVAHTAATAVYKLHESASVTIASFGTRNVIRVRVTRIDDTLESIASESTIIKPTNPPNNAYTTLYGVVVSAQGAAVSAEDVTLTISDSGAYQIGTGDVLYKQTETTTTDADGYFEFFVPRSIRTDSDKEISLVIGSGAGQMTWAVETVPDVDTINFVET